tara:strand:+ start:948 stop:2051 length:1104 start_codon:yes stop_codon:yes gene_type:complete
MADYALFDLVKNKLKLDPSIVEQNPFLRILNTVEKPKYTKGGNKTIYFFPEKEKAIAIELIRENGEVNKTYDGKTETVEEIKERRINLYEKMKMIEQQHDCLINYPEEYYFFKININFAKVEPAYISVSQLKFCPDGDTFETFAKSYFYYNELMNLMKSYTILHNYNIFHIDIKPENIFKCKCGNKTALFIGDIDDAVLYEENKSPYQGTITGTPPYTPTYIFFKRNAIGVKREDLEFADWYALAYLYCLNQFQYTKKTKQDKDKELEKALFPSNYGLELDTVRISIDEKKYMDKGTGNIPVNTILSLSIQLLNSMNNWVEDKIKFQLNDYSTFAYKKLKDEIEIWASKHLVFNKENQIKLSNFLKF